MTFLSFFLRANFDRRKHFVFSQWRVRHLRCNRGYFIARFCLQFTILANYKYEESHPELVTISSSFSLREKCENVHLHFRIFSPASFQLPPRPLVQVVAREKIFSYANTLWCVRNPGRRIKFSITPLQRSYVIVCARTGFRAVIYRIEWQHAPSQNDIRMW